LPSSNLANITFEEADGRSLPFENGAFDVVVFDSTLSHVPRPERALAEAHRVRRGGRLAVFDGDYATATVALHDHGPVARLCRGHDGEFRERPLVDAPALQVAGDAGFQAMSFHSHGFSELEQAPTCFRRWQAGRRHMALGRGDPVLSGVVPRRGAPFGRHRTA
jgi:SAM-dependent methyltransferase